ncbi:MAG: DUF554 domain-containing protein, partial [Firmicutes bacterium]|nr:DUF554 domain-containing protein [Bacillota bacterium]
MIGIGTLVNVIAIITGAVAGSLVRGGLPEKIKSIIMQGVGLAVMFIGLSGALQGLFTVAGNGLERQYVMLMIASMVIGGIIGELLQIEAGLEKAGRWFEKKFARSERTFAQGFITASLVYCVGAMAIVGALEDGLIGDVTTLFSKSILDGVTAVIFAAGMGMGVALSALPVLVYQGSITLLAGVLRPLLTVTVIQQMSLVGGILIFAIGLNLLKITRIKVGNLLPAIFIPLFYYILLLLFGL